MRRRSGCAWSARRRANQSEFFLDADRCSKLMRAKSNLLNGIKLIWVVQSPLKKYFA